MPIEAQRDPFEALFLGDDGLDEEALDALLAGVEHDEAPTDGRDRVLREVSFADRFAEYAAPLSKILDVHENTAAELLAGLDNTLEWGTERALPMLKSIWVDGGPAVQQSVRGFVRIAAGETFPAHGHLGKETCIVLQGYMEMDDGRVLAPGDVYSATVDDHHSFRARPGGPDLLYFVVVREGITIGNASLRHRD